MPETPARDSSLAGASGLYLAIHISLRVRASNRPGLAIFVGPASVRTGPCPYNYQQLWTRRIFLLFPVAQAESRSREALEKAGSCASLASEPPSTITSAARTPIPRLRKSISPSRSGIPHISLATVYKALDALVDARLINRVVGEHGPARYDCRREDHYHFRCLKSGAVHDVPTAFDAELLDKLDPNLVAELERRGFHVTNYRLEVLGYFEGR